MDLCYLFKPPRIRAIYGTTGSRKCASGANFTYTSPPRCRQGYRDTVVSWPAAALVVFPAVVRNALSVRSFRRACFLRVVAAVVLCGAYHSTVLSNQVRIGLIFRALPNLTSGCCTLLRRRASERVVRTTWSVELFLCVVAVESLTFPSPCMTEPAHANFIRLSASPCVCAYTVIL